MIFLSEQPQTGMNEGTWFTQGMCINKTKVFLWGGRVAAIHRGQQVRVEVSVERVSAHSGTISSHCGH